MINVKKLADTLQSRRNCMKTPDTHSEWIDIHTNTIMEMCKELPHGSGIDGTMEIDFDQCNDKKITFFFEYHHMDDNGYYDGWTEHNIIITPDFGSFKIRINGPDRNQVKDYFYDLFACIFE